MQTKNSIKARLVIAAQDAIVSANGSFVTAYKIFDEWLFEQNDAALERALCSRFRRSAISALIGEQIGKERESESETDARQWRPGQGVNQDLRPSPEAMNNALILNSFKVNGEPIGDCTVETVSNAAAKTERDARFMRFLISGLPPTGTIRQYRTDEEAERLWRLAQTGSSTHIAS